MKTPNEIMSETIDKLEAELAEAHLRCATLGRMVVNRERGITLLVLFACIEAVLICALLTARLGTR